MASQLNYPKGLLAGQVAIITGSGQGIGAEMARVFAAEGAKVVVSDVDAGMSQSCLHRDRLEIAGLTTATAKAAEVAKSITASGGQAIAVGGDLLNDAHIPELVKKAAEFGNGKIHIIVNNAGFTWDGVIHRVCANINPNTWVRKFEVC